MTAWTRAPVRKPVAAGRFYASDPVTLQREVRELLDEALRTGSRANGTVPKALIAPHAGYMYSGPIAASAYAQIQGAEGVRRVVIIGPAHFVTVTGVATTPSEAFRTPLGDVPVDSEVINSLSGLPQVTSRADAHAPDHALETQLPFLQVLLKDFSIVPLLVGKCAATDMESVLERLWGGPETLVVVSSDMSHYLSYESAKTADAATAKAIENLNASMVRDDSACGAIPIRAVLSIARKKELEARTLDLRNSGDTAGSRDQVVGYGAFSFSDKN